MLIGMAIPAHIRDTEMKFRSSGILSIMCTVTVGADGNILIIFGDQSSSMDTLLVDRIDGAMTLLAPLCIQGLFKSPGKDGVGPMTVYTDRGIRPSLHEHTIMNAFKGACIFVKMASPATLF